MDRFEAPRVCEPFTVEQSGGPTIGPEADHRYLYGRRSIRAAIRRSGRVGADWPKSVRNRRFQPPELVGANNGEGNDEVI